MLEVTEQGFCSWVANQGIRITFPGVIAPLSFRSQSRPIDPTEGRAGLPFLGQSEGRRRTASPKATTSCDAPFLVEIDGPVEGVSRPRRIGTMTGSVADDLPVVCPESTRVPDLGHA